MEAAARSLMEPPGLTHSSLAQDLDALHARQVPFRQPIETEQRGVADAFEQSHPKRPGRGNHFKSSLRSCAARPSLFAGG